MVGGAVRDRLLGRQVADRDWVVTGGTAEELTALGYKCVGRDFPVFLHPETKEEYALARAERKIGPGYRGFHFDTSPTVTLEDDLRRRDLTINAMAEDCDGRLIDPFNGQRDLHEGVLRHVSPAFAEDPVRILRVARFAARYGFRVADETVAMIRQIVANGEAETLIPERVWVEFERALTEPFPRRFLEVLREGHALAAIFPEIEALFRGAEAKEVVSGLRALNVLDEATRLSDEAEVRFAALVHDIGRVHLPGNLRPHSTETANLSVDLITQLCHRLRAPKKFRDLATIVASHYGDCEKALQLDVEEIYQLLASVDALRRPERFQQFLLCCEAASFGNKETEYRQAVVLRAALVAIRKIDLRSIVSEGISPQARKNQIESARIATLRQIFGNDRGLSKRE